MYRLTQMFSDTLRPMRGKILKRILTWLCCTKHNEINICHSDVQDHVSYIGSHKDFLYNMGYAWIWLEIHFQLCFMVCFYYTKFNALSDAHAV